MKKFYLDYISKNWWFYFLLLFSVSLIIASWIVPPTGEISPSVLTAIGELAGLGAIGTVIKAIDEKTSASMTHGSTSITVTSEGNSNNNVLNE